MTEREEGKLEEKMNTLDKGITTVINIAREVRDEMRSNYVTKESLSTTILQIGGDLSKQITGVRGALETLMETHFKAMDLRIDDQEKRILRVENFYKAAVTIISLVAVVVGIVGFFLNR